MKIRKIDFTTTKPVPKTNESDPNLTFRELAAAWLACACTDKPNEHHQMVKWLDLYGDRNAWAVTTAELNAAGAAMIEHGYSPATVNRNFSTLGSMWGWIIAKHRAPAGFISPTLAMERHSEPVRRVFIEPATLAALRAASMTFKDKRFPLFVHLLIDTGARKSELLERTWADFDLDKGEVILHDSKTGVPRVLHFTQSTTALIKRLAPHRPPAALVFPGRVPSEPISYRASWAALTKEVGQPGLHLHDIRHNRARELVTSGVGLGVAAAVMGHGVRMLERRYGHLDVTDARRAVEASWAQQAAA